jgi:hypothetical protein
MRPRWPVQGRLVPEAEADSKSCWTGPPASIGRPGWSSLPPPLPLSSSWPSPMFLINMISLGSNLFSKVWKGSLKNELTSKLSCRLRAQVIGPCIMDGGTTGASKRVMSSSPPTSHPTRCHPYQWWRVGGLRVLVLLEWRFAGRALVEALQYHSRWCVLLSPWREDRRRRKHVPCCEIHVSHCLLHNGSFDLISTMDSVIVGEGKRLRRMNRNFRFVATQFVGIHTTKSSGFCPIHVIIAC